MDLGLAGACEEVGGIVEEIGGGIGEEIGGGDTGEEVRNSDGTGLDTVLRLPWLPLRTFPPAPDPCHTKLSTGAGSGSIGRPQRRYGQRHQLLGCAPWERKKEDRVGRMAPAAKRREEWDGGAPLLEHGIH